MCTKSPQHEKEKVRTNSNELLKVKDEEIKKMTEDTEVYRRTFERGFVIARTLSRTF